MSDHARSVLELNEASVFSEEGSGQFLLRDISLTLRAGDILLVRAEASEEVELFLDICQGLVAVDSGTYSFLGERWSGMSRRCRASCRSRIGRISLEETWISNLDLRDNILLAQAHHHGKRGAAELYEEAMSYGRVVGITELPQQRPEELADTSLRKYQWIRAFMGSPVLMLLDRPELEVDESDVTMLIDLLIDSASHGSAIVWFTAANVTGARPRLSSARNVVLQDGSIRLEGDRQ